jgi:hypothetical protein
MAQQKATSALKRDLHSEKENGESVCVYVKETERVCVVCVCVCERNRESVCCVCMCVKETERVCVRERKKHL